MCALNRLNIHFIKILVKCLATRNVSSICKDITPAFGKVSR